LTVAFPLAHSQVSRVLNLISIQGHTIWVIFDNTNSFETNAIKIKYQLSKNSEKFKLCRHIVFW